MCRLPSSSRKGWGSRNKFFGADGGADRPKVSLLADVSDPIAPQVVSGLLQKVSFTAAPRIMAVEGLTIFEKYTGPLTPDQRKAVDEWQKGDGPALTPEGSLGTSIGLPIEVVNVMQGGRDNAPMVSFYAAGIGVMFLLFSCSGAGGTLLDEEESGTLDRLIGSRAGMGGCHRRQMGLPYDDGHHRSSRSCSPGAPWCLACRSDRICPASSL